jgi:hypothetical protein
MLTRSEIVLLLALPRIGLAAVAQGDQAREEKSKESSELTAKEAK